jgi:hypothetical protein
VSDLDQTRIKAWSARSSLLALTVILIEVTGCGGKDSPPLVPVSGVVLYEGKPLIEHAITFNPVGSTPGSGSIGGTGTDGRFSLTDVRGESGAYVGEYRVSFYPTPSGSALDNPANAVKLTVNVLPGSYIDSSNSPVRATVGESGGSIQIALNKSGTGSSAATKAAP